MKYGLEIMGIKARKEKTKVFEFHKHFGSSPLDIAQMWSNLCELEGKLKPKEKSMRGFNRFLMAIFWLWTYPKNSSLMASRFKVCKDYCQGKHLWTWIQRVADLKEQKIKWDDSLDDPAGEIFVVSADGVDFRTWEKKHDKFNIDQKACSHKWKHCAAKYLVVLSTFRAQCVMVAGPYLGGVSDLEMFIDCGLMDKLKANNKVAIVDRGFRSKKEDERKHHAYPDGMDSKELNNFKARARL